MTTKEENTTQPKNLIAKIQAIKSELLWKNLKKSWQNKHAWFKYYELSDILPAIIELCTKYGVFTQIIFDNEFAKLEVVNVDLDKNVILVKGSVPGNKGAILKIRNSVKSSK